MQQLCRTIVYASPLALLSSPSWPLFVHISRIAFLLRQLYQFVPVHDSCSREMGFGTEIEDVDGLLGGSLSITHVPLSFDPLEEAFPGTLRVVSFALTYE